MIYLMVLFPVTLSDP